jgi:hypothetical protein
MARPRPIPGLDPDRRLRPNARRILAVRIREVYAHDRAVRDPARVRELHDLRIACKRLRYLLEIFGVAFRAALDPFVEELRGLQDLLGEIHDRDVQVPLLEDHLRRLEAGAAGAVTVPADPAVAIAAGDGAPADLGAAARRARRDPPGALFTDERPGVRALLERRRREREELYARFLEEWARLRRRRFRKRLEAALGL